VTGCQAQELTDILQSATAFSSVLSSTSSLPPPSFLYSLQLGVYMLIPRNPVRQQRQKQLRSNLADEDKQAHKNWEWTMIWVQTRRRDTENCFVHCRHSVASLSSAHWASLIINCLSFRSSTFSFDLMLHKHKIHLNLSAEQITLQQSSDVFLSCSHKYN